MKKKLDKKEVLKKRGKTLKEFKEFISKGNVIDLAVGVIIGSAFGKIVSSLVDNIIMPLIGVIIGGIDFTGLSFTVKDATITYGVFIQNVIDFLIIAFCIFMFTKIITKFNKKAVEEQETEEEIKDEKVALLEEIRDLLKENQKIK